MKRHMGKTFLTAAIFIAAGTVRAGAASAQDDARLSVDQMQYIAATSLTTDSAFVARNRVDPEQLSVGQMLHIAVTSRTTDSVFFALNRVIPSFGGLYKDQEGTVRIALVDLAEAEAAGPVIKAYFLKRRAAEGAEFSTINMTFISAAFTWFDLEDYKTRLTGVLSLPNVVYVDADEVCNCVTIAVSNAESRGFVEEFVAQSGVPWSAVSVIERPEVIPAVSLRDKFRPVVGGISVVPSSGQDCTITAVAHHAGEKGFIVNSHCTETQGGVEGTAYIQGDLWSYLGSTGPNFATERVDPAWTALPGCPPGRICRRSDSAFAGLDSAFDGSLLEIALPSTFCMTAPCGLDLANASDRLSISGLAGAPIVGDYRNKIGQTTGHTRGNVNVTCATVNAMERSIFDPNNFTLLCQNFVGAALAPGDSGSPVFSLLSGL